MSKLLEKTFSCTLIFFYAGALADFIPQGHIVYTLKEVSAYVVFGITCTLLFCNWKKATCLISKQPALWVLLLFLIFSVSWSDYPSETFEGTIPMIRVTVFAIYLATRFTLREQVLLFSVAFTIAAILSLLFAIVLPQYGVVGVGFVSNMEDIVHAGKWRGIYVHKNLLGINMALGMLICLYALFNEPKLKKMVFIGFSTCAFALIKSNSSSALVFLFFSVVLIPCYRAIRLQMKLAIPLFSILFVAGGFLLTGGLFAANQLLGSLGKDITLTGRTIYWPLMLDKILERPWLGYGYDAFWIGGRKGEVADVWRFLAFGNEPPHAHNGYLNLWFDVGLIGLVIFFVGLAANYMRAIQFTRITRTVEGLLPITFLTFWILVNLTESFLVEPKIYWAFYVSTSLSMYKKANYSNPE